MTIQQQDAYKSETIRLTLIADDERESVTPIAHPPKAQNPKCSNLQTSTTKEYTYRYSAVNEVNAPPNSQASIVNGCYYFRRNYFRRNYFRISLIIIGVIESVSSLGTARQSTVCSQAVVRAFRS